MDQAPAYQNTPRWRASRSACASSPHCYLPSPIVEAMAGRDGLWLHAGPISTDTTPLAFHRAERALGDQNAGQLIIETPRAHRPFAGCQRDLYCLDRNPGGQAQRHIQVLGGARAVVWCVFAVAWREPGGPHVSWVAPGLDLAIEGWNTFYGADRPGAALHEEASRLMDLLAGGARRRGRPPRWHDPAWRDVVERIEAQKRAYPHLPIDDIARRMGVSTRTYRDYAKLAERERANGLHLLDGGPTP
jgi:hypothetical protein